VRQYWPLLAVQDVPRGSSEGPGFEASDLFLEFPYYGGITARVSAKMRLPNNIRHPPTVKSNRSQAEAQDSRANIGHPRADSASGTGESRDDSGIRLAVTVPR
jgi:hypothetical protein